MIEVSSRIKKAFQSDSIYKRYFIYFPNIDSERAGFNTISNSGIADDSIKITENLNNEDQLHYGRCEGNMIEFEMGYTPFSLVGQIIDVYMILADYDTEPFAIGRYVISEEKIENERLTKVLTAYDILSILNNLDVSYWCYNTTFPTTIKQLRNSILNYVGQNQVDKDLINDDIIVVDNPWTGENDITFNRVISSICEWNAVFGGINRTGLFDYYKLTPTDNTETYPSTGLFPSNSTFPKSIRGKNYYIDPHTIKDDMTWDNYICKPIDIIQVRDSENKSIMEYAIPGTTDMNIYVIKDNDLAGHFSTEDLIKAVTRFAQAVYKVYYTPVKANVKMDLSLEVGDPITLTASDGRRIPTFILKRTASGGIVAFDEIEATGKEEFENEVSDKATDEGMYDELAEQLNDVDDRLTNVEEGGGITILSVEALPEAPKKNVLYLVQGNVYVR